MEQLTGDAILQRIGGASETDMLREIRDQASDALQTVSLGEANQWNAYQWNGKVNALHDALIRRSITLTERDMENRGWGLPPVSYAFLLFGSGGRSEQTLWSDQDNGLVYRDPPVHLTQAAADYFTSFAELLVSRLEAIGYPPCDGNVTCLHAMWRQPVKDWLKQIEAWLAEPNWEHMRYTLILADMRVLHGEESLGAEIRGCLNERLASEPALLRHLLDNTLHRKVALGLFGQLITERYGEAAGGVDVKYGSYIPMVNAVRWLAMQAGLDVSSTQLRLAGLAGRGIISEELLDDWRDAFAVNLRLRAVLPRVAVEGKYSTDGKLPAELLTPSVKKELKLCLHAGERLQKFVKHRMEKEFR